MATLDRAQEGRTPRATKGQGWLLPWRAGFQANWVPRDLTAGIALGVIMVPQGMAYATLAGLPPETGLYATMAAILGYLVLGSSRQLVVGPDSSTSTILGAALVGIAGAGAATDLLAGMAAAIALIAGGILVLAGLLKAGIIANFISKPVLVGYINALAVTIIVGQASKILGFQVEADGVIPEAWEMLRRLGDTQLLPLVVGGACLAVILVLQRLAPKVPGALVAVVGALVASTVLDLEADGLAVVGALPSGLPSIAVPVDALGEFGGLLLLPAFAVAVMGFADTTVTASIFGERGRYQVDANKDLLGLGAASAFSGLAGGLPVSASDSRTAVAVSAGGRSQVVNLTGAIVIGIILVFFASVLGPLPSAALSAVVIAAGISLFDFATFRAMARQSRSDLWTGLVALVGALTLGLLPGIILAVVLSLFNVLMSAARTQLVVLGRGEVGNAWRNVARDPGVRTVPGLQVVRWESSLFFGNGQGFTQQVKSLVEGAPSPVSWVVLDAEATSDADFTGTSALRDLVRWLRERGVTFVVAEPNGRFLDALQASGCVELIGGEHILPSVDMAAKAYVDQHPGVVPPSGPEAVGDVRQAASSGSGRELDQG
ncbi:MAG TPA: SulP family inorganic anion transporter [Candidatus Nanopelagicales bacterium]